MVVIWSKEAIADLRDYSQNSKIITEGKVQKYTDDLVDFVDSLSTNPQLGRTYIQYNNISIRRLIFKMHSIFYYILNNEIIIIKISHHHQNIDNVIDLIKDFIKNIDN